MISLAWMLCIPFLVAAPSHAESLVDVDAALAYDSNASQGADAGTIHGDASAALAVTARSFNAQSGFDALVLGAGAGAERHARYRGLDNEWAQGSAVYRHKLGLGTTAPWIRVEGTVAYHHYGVDVRTGPRFSLRAEAGKRFSEALDGRIGVFSDARRSPYGDAEYPEVPGHAFDLHGHGIDIGAAYAVSDALLAGVNASVRRGDVVATATEQSRALPAATAVTEDSTFGDDLYDYRLRGTTYALVLSLNWALDARSSLNLVHAGEQTSAGAGLAYRNHATRIEFLHRY